MEVDGGRMRLAMGAGPGCCGRVGDGEHCSKFRSTKSWTEQVAEPSSSLPCGFTHRWSRGDHPPPMLPSGARVGRAKETNRPYAPPFLVCALGEQRKLPSLPILHFAEPSSDWVVRFHPPPEQRGPSTSSPSTIPVLLLSITQRSA
jgi:hypothetical protein